MAAPKIVQNSLFVITEAASNLSGGVALSVWGHDAATNAFLKELAYPTSQATRMWLASITPEAYHGIARICETFVRTDLLLAALTGLWHLRPKTQLLLKASL